MLGKKTTKRKKTEEIRKAHTAEQLPYTTQMKLREAGEIHAAKLCKEAILTSPTRPVREC